MDNHEELHWASSALTASGRWVGIGELLRLVLMRNMASTNSGNVSLLGMVVFAKAQICARTALGSLAGAKATRALSAGGGSG